MINKYYNIYNIYIYICQDPGLFCCVFSPHVFPVTQFFLHVDCLIWSQVCLLSSLVNLSLKAPVLSVSVCRSLNVIPGVLVSPMFSFGLLKTLVYEFLVLCFRALCVSWQYIYIYIYIFYYYYFFFFLIWQHFRNNGRIFFFFFLG